MSRKLTQTIRIPLLRRGRHANIIRRARKAIDNIPPLRLFADGASALPGLPQLRTLVEGSGVRIEIPAECGWSGRDIEMLLYERGVTIWHKLAGARVISFYVKEEQAEWTRWILRNAGLLGAQERSS